MSSSEEPGEDEDAPTGVQQTLGNTLTYGENIIRKKEKQEEHYWSHRVRSAIRACNLELKEGRRENYLHILNILKDILFPLVIHSDRTESVEDYHLELESDNDYEWSWTAVHRFSMKYEDYRQLLVHGEKTRETESLLLKSRGVVPEEESAKKTIERAFRSVESIVEFEEVVANELVSKVPADGLNIQLGQHLQPYDMDLGESVKIVETEKGSLKTAYIGDTGEGKSATLEAEMQDRYEGGKKVVDLVDFKQFANACYDIPQQQQTLRKAREDLGLGPDFTEQDDHSQPEVEILVPICSNLEDTPIPYDTEADEFVVKPVSIPWSIIPSDVLISLFSVGATDSQESEIRKVFSQVQGEGDYSLPELAEEIRKTESIEDKMKDKLIHLVNSLNESEFIRTQSDPHAIDFEERMRDTDTITVFSESLLDRVGDKVMFVLCILGIIRDIRDDAHNLPPMTLGMKEMAKIAPHKERRSFDNTASAIQKTIGTLLGEIFRDNRSNQLEILGDTQTLGDLIKDVRQDFNRAVVFSPGAVYDVAANLKSVRSHSASQAARSMRTEVGMGAVIGNARTINKHQGIGYLAPIKFAPASWHHYDADGSFGTGLHRRVDYHDHEELRTPQDQGVEWAFRPDADINPDKLEADEYEPEKAPVQAFAQDCLTEATGGKEGEWYDDVKKTFKAYCEQHNLDVGDLPFSNPTSFGRKLAKNLEYENKSRMVDGEQGQMLVGVEFTETGDELFYSLRDN